MHEKQPAPDNANQPENESKKSGTNDLKEKQDGVANEARADAGLVKKEIGVSKFYTVDIDKNLLKKRGFLIALEGNGEAKTLQEQELAKIRHEYADLLRAYRESQLRRINNLHESDARHKDMLLLLEAKRKEYEDKIKNIPEEKKVIEEQLEKIQQDVYKVLIEIGREKENIVETSLKNYKANIELGIKINRDVQNEQNAQLESEFLKFKSSDEEKVKFWTKIHQNYQEHYDKVTERLKFLAKDGINHQTSAFLIFLGTVAALVSGWWFSIWTGENNNIGLNQNNVPDNSNVRFFFLDNLARFLSHFSLWEIMLGLLIYIVAVGTVSWICYSLLIRNRFIRKPKGPKELSQAGSSEETDDFEVKLQESDDLLKTTFKGNSWWAIWLKIAPVIFALVPLLFILSKGAEDDKSKNFQSLFNSLVNDFIGTCIAVSFSTFTILYFSRVTENKYHAADTHSKSKSGPVFYFGFVIFALMIASMLLYHYSPYFFNDIRRIAIMGFVVSCIATGFSMGYGYLFRNLSINAEFLLDRISTISDIIYRYSKPFAVNYTSNGLLRQRIYYLQHKMMSLIANRQELAVAIAGGYDVQYNTAENTPKPTLQPIEEKDPETQGKSKPVNLLDQVITFFKLRWLMQKEQDEKQKTKHNILHSISGVEMKYFSEKSEHLSELNQRVKELRMKLEKMEKEQEEYLRNEGIYRSLNDQIRNMEESNRKVVEEITKIESEILYQTDKLNETTEKSGVFLREGFQTGVWFKHMNNDPGNALVIA